MKDWGKAVLMVLAIIVITAAATYTITKSSLNKKATKRYVETKSTAQSGVSKSTNSGNPDTDNPDLGSTEEDVEGATTEGAPTTDMRHPLDIIESFIHDFNSRRYDTLASYFVGGKASGPYKAMQKSISPVAPADKNNWTIEVTRQPYQIDPETASGIEITMEEGGFVHTLQEEKGYEVIVILVGYDRREFISNPQSGISGYSRSPQTMVTMWVRKDKSKPWKLRYLAF